MGLCVSSVRSEAPPQRKQTDHLFGPATVLEDQNRRQQTQGPSWREGLQYVTAVHPSSTSPAQTAPSENGSGQVSPRHTRCPVYRCFLPDLAGFAGSRCVGPNHLCRSTVPALRGRASDGHRPRYSGLRVQGTATSPSSTANHRKGRANPRSVRDATNTPLPHEGCCPNR